MVCTFSLELLDRLAPGETWRFLRAAQNAVEEAGGIWDGDMSAGVVMLGSPQGEIMAEWERDGSTIRVSIAHPDAFACNQIESAVRERAAAWLAKPPQPVAQAPLEGQPVLDITVTPAKAVPMWVWIALGGVGAVAVGYGIAYLTQTTRKRRKR